MIHDPCSVDQALTILNEMVRADPEAVRSLVEARVPCNRALAYHPTVQVSQKDNGFSVGFLGVINGIFGTDAKGWGPFTAYFDITCPNCATIADGVDIGDLCPNCGGIFELGPLTRFSRTKHKED
jgi:hypothetical protein